MFLAYNVVRVNWHRRNSLGALSIREYQIIKRHHMYNGADVIEERLRTVTENIRMHYSWWNTTQY